MCVEVDERLRDVEGYSAFVDFYNGRHGDVVRAVWAGFPRQGAYSSEHGESRVIWRCDGKMMSDTLVLLPAARFAELVAAERRPRGANTAATVTFVELAEVIVREHSSLSSETAPNIVFIILGLEKYFPNRQKKVGGVSYDDAESCLFDAAMRGINVWRHPIEGPVELSDFIMSMSKSLSTIPRNQRAKSVGFEWHTASFNGAVSVDERGVGLRNLWIKMISTVRGATPEIATAIADVYPSMLSLVDVSS